MNLIVAAARNWAIGKENDLLFHLPTDMKHFRQLTEGGTVIMGRRTLDSLPGGKPLPRRRNIVVTRDTDFAREGVEVVHCEDEALSLIAGTDPETVWVMGGGSVYTVLLHLCRKAIVTRVDADVLDADTFFPNLDKLGAWKLVSSSDPVEENGLTFRFTEYVNTTL